MTETEFADRVAGWLWPFVQGYEVATKKSVLYAVSFDEHGHLQLGLDAQGEPVRGGGTGFEQDILVFERLQPDQMNAVPQPQTTIVPRVIAEVKLGRVTTHDTLTYAEKARRIRVIYPFVRYGLILGEMSSIPPRALRLGQEFDFIMVIGASATLAEIENLGRVFTEELQASRDLGIILSGRKRVKGLFRGLKPDFE